MSLKANTNKIHADLLQNFDDVELVAINENKELVIVVEKRQLEQGKFTWGYYSNPLTKEYLVERVSTVDSLIDDVKDIFNKNRFDEDYLKEINN